MGSTPSAIRRSGQTALKLDHGNVQRASSSLKAFSRRPCSGLLKFHIIWYVMSAPGVLRCLVLCRGISKLVHGKVLLEEGCDLETIGS